MADETVSMLLEVVVLPVADADRSKAFYQGLGWRLDADINVDEGHRVVQFTPPESPASIQFGKGITTTPSGSVRDVYLIVEDVAAARNALMSNGAQVSDVWHGLGPGGDRHRPGPDPDRGTYRSCASFADPDDHGTFEAVAPKHNWWDWYAAYMDARQRGSSPDDAAAAAGRYMADIKHIVVS